MSHGPMTVRQPMIVPRQLKQELYLDCTTMAECRRCRDIGVNTTRDNIVEQLNYIASFVCLIPNLKVLFICIGSFREYDEYRLFVQLMFVQLC